MAVSIEFLSNARTRRILLISSNIGVLAQPRCISSAPKGWRPLRSLKVYADAESLGCGFRQAANVFPASSQCIDKIVRSPMTYCPKSADRGIRDDCRTVLWMSS